MATNLHAHASEGRVNGRSQADSRTEENIRAYADKTVAEISGRIRQLETQWDMERAIDMGAGALTVAGLALAAARGRKWLLLSGVATSFLVWQSLRGWSPPVPALRRAGMRTRAEIDREIYALKALRGDFQKVHRKRSRPQAHVTKAIDAVATEPEAPREAAAPETPPLPEEPPFGGPDEMLPPEE